MHTNVCIKGDVYYAANNYIATNYGLSLQLLSILVLAISYSTF